MRFMTISLTDQTCPVQLLLFEHSLLYDLSLFRQIGLVLDRHIEDLNF